MTSISTTRDDAHAARASHDVALPAWRAAIRKVTAVIRKTEPYAQSTLLFGLRLVYGWFFAQAGWGKLMNLERTSGFFESLGLPTPAFMAALVGLTELVGGVLLVAGMGTRLAAATLSVVMLAAYATAHADDALASLTAFTEQAPYPFLVATLVVLAFGAGAVSIDGLLRSRSQRRWSVSVAGRKTD